MNIDVTARHMELTDSLKDHVEKALDGVSRHYDRILGATVVFDQVRHNFEVEIQLKVRGHVLLATAKSNDAYLATDQTCEKLIRQVTDYKEKRRGAKIANKETAVPGAVEEEEDDE